MNETTTHSATNRAHIYAAMRAQIETVLPSNGSSAARYDHATATGIKITRNDSGGVALWSLTASGYELRFSCSAMDGWVRVYESDSFAMRLLETWAQEVKAQCETESELRSHLAARGVETPETSAQAPQIPAVKQDASQPRNAPERAKSPREKQMACFCAVMTMEGMEQSRDKRLAFAAHYFNRAPIASFKELSPEQIGRLADAISRGDVEPTWVLCEATFAAAA